MSYRINEVFYSLQGEGAKAGSACVFVRFSGCNLACRKETEGFDCDTEFTSGESMTASEVASMARTTVALDSPLRVGVIFTGGEPMLQLDAGLLLAFEDQEFHDLRVETNGTVAIPEDVRDALSWIACSPKTAEHTLRISKADEVRYVRRHGQGIPRPSIEAGYKFISPAFGPDGLDPADLLWCVDLVRANPEWRLSMQQHKTWRVR